jgi:flavin-dependent dehydrogenase
MRSDAADEKYDALILGGGPGGATAGLMLAKAGWRVAIVEKSHFPRRKVCGDFISATTLMLLDELGVSDRCREFAGPEVRCVGLFEQDTVLTAPMPPASGAGWGRAVGREHLDCLLLSAAGQAGARLWQPWKAGALKRQAHGWLCSINHATQNRELYAPVIIIATGSWGQDSMTGKRAVAHQNSDLLAFKAYYRDCDLPSDLMPLLVFTGGYGGMVHAGNGLVSLSCCMQWDILRRRRGRQQRAGEAVLQYILESCAGVGAALGRAALDRTWLAAGPIRPGIRQPYSDGVFFVGNIAGEAHPIIAEGISMAIQSAWLLCRRLIAHETDAAAGRQLEDIGRDYGAKWYEAFAFRIRAAALFATFAIHPGAGSLVWPVLKRCPGLLTFGAYLSGKSRHCEKT